MMRFLIYLTTLAVMTYWLLTLFMTSLSKANDYNTAVIGHVITQKVTGQPIDTSKIMEQELTRLAHNYAIDVVSVLQKYLPSMLDNLSAQLRAEADKNYKCNLIKDTSMKCND